MSDEKDTINSTLRLPPPIDAAVKKEARTQSRTKHEQLLHILKERYGLTSNGATRKRQNSQQVVEAR